NSPNTNASQESRTFASPASKTPDAGAEGAQDRSAPGNIAASRRCCSRRPATRVLFNARGGHSLQSANLHRVADLSLARERGNSNSHPRLEDHAAWIEIRS